MDRKNAIQKAAERLRAKKALPQGKWVPLDAHVKLRGSSRVAGRNKYRSRGMGRNAKAGWAVLVTGCVERGDRVEVHSNSTGTCVRYVHAVIKSALERQDGWTLVSVGEHPPEPEVPAPVVSAPMPNGSFVSRGRQNPRECEECGARVSPGAGKCARCRKK